jgi:hypothetical protein
MAAAQAVCAIRGALPVLVIVRATLRAYLAKGDGGQEARATSGGEEQREDAEPDPKHRSACNTSALGALKFCAQGVRA